MCMTTAQGEFPPSVPSELGDQNLQDQNQNIISTDDDAIDQSLTSNIKHDTFLFTCQITGLNEAKLTKIISNQYEMIVDFDFYVQDGKMLKTKSI